ncbi:Crp/Fnr family transcriptional regulator [Halomonas sp. SpR1]|uniref:Crp/Fnr family transcriptional regulator n=1 Tax=Halomonas sp. SpR1 TaxID=3050462 RepID=UPI0027E3C0CE|nr:Crp/Fnr family transcriptional regulator [Halomonas sp. SpR1]MDQ7734881.1 Crp/Fnr family transcriptional regulator [Halomonas sp. SpR1]
MPTALSAHTYLMIRKIESNYTLTAEEKLALQKLPVQTVDVKSNQDIVKMGDQPTQCCLLLEGFSCVYKLTLEGKRQIMALHIPGDMPDLQSLHLQVIDINIASLSPCKLGFIQHHDLHLLFEHHPRLINSFWHETLVDASIFREWLLNVGQREGYSRIAHVICELLLRLKAVGLVEDNSFHMPISQAELADATGMTPVHVNRVLQALRNNGLIITNRRQITIPDWQKLQEAGGFDSLYLHLKSD